MLLMLQEAASIGSISNSLLGPTTAKSLVKHLSPGFQQLFGERIATCRLCPLALALWVKTAPSLQVSPGMGWQPTTCRASIWGGF